MQGDVLFNLTEENLKEMEVDLMLTRTRTLTLTLILTLILTAAKSAGISTSCSEIVPTVVTVPSETEYSKLSSPE